MWNMMFGSGQSGHDHIANSTPDTPGTGTPSTFGTDYKDKDVQRRPLDIPILSQLSNKRVILASGSPRRREILSHLLPDFEIITPQNPEARPISGETPMEYVLKTAHAKCMEVYEREIDNKDAKGRELGLVIAADTIVCTWSGDILGKPSGPAHNIQMLKVLRDGPAAMFEVTEKRVTKAVTAAANKSTRTDEGITMSDTLAEISGIPGLDDITMLGRIKGEASSSSAGIWCRVYTAITMMRPLETATDPGYAYECEVESTGILFNPEVSDSLIEAYVRTGEGADKAGGFGIQGLGSILIERVEGSADNVIGLPLKTTLRLIQKVLTDEVNDDEDVLDEVEKGYFDLS